MRAYMFSGVLIFDWRSLVDGGYTMPIYLLCAVPSIAKHVDKADSSNDTMTPVLKQMAVQWRVWVCFAIEHRMSVFL